MRPYKIAYRCRLCGELVFTGAVNLDETKIPEKLGDMVRVQRFASNPVLCKDIPPMIVAHPCCGGGGLADFAGFMGE